MGLLLLLIKKTVLLCLLFLASMDSTSMAGRSSKTMTTEFAPEMVSVDIRHKGDETRVHEGRILEVDTNDYGKYDPPPALVRPPFKQIPN